jgi:hypothetical protein
MSKNTKISIDEFMLPGTMNLHLSFNCCLSVHVDNYTIIIIIGIQPLGRSGQRPELS